MLFPFLYSPAAQLVISLIKSFGIFFFLLFLGIAVYSLFKSPTYIPWSFWYDWVEFFSQKAYASGKAEKRWRATSKRLASPNAADWKLAIIEAETLIDDVLTRLGFGGQSFGERLKKVNKDTIPSLDNLTAAHQTRNNIVHDPDYRLDLAEATKTFAAYEKALKELDVL